ncbi:hypothetical protein SeMB42_g03882 [Synchytrium endobioticum]|nr:hypothetical protein SeMB42_g03882 [Synchytrium endobioticum]
MKHIREILDVMRKKSSFPKQSECVWFTKEIEMMGLIVNKHGYQKNWSPPTKRNPERLIPIIKYGTPTNPKEIRTFTGMVNFYRPFCNRLSIVAKPLYELTGKDARFVWTAQHQDASTMVKEIVTSEVFLLFPDFQKTFTLSFDASEVAVGAVLQQLDYKGNLRPVEFYSRKWISTEWNHSTPDNELYALILSLQHWCHWLYGASKTS